MIATWMNNMMELVEMVVVSVLSLDFSKASNSGYLAIIS